MRTSLLMALAALAIGSPSLAFAQSAPAPQPVLLRITDRCDMIADGQRIPVGELRTRTEQWSRDGREVRIRFDGHVSASCANDIVSTLNDAHVMRFGFFDPSQVDLFVPDGPCRVELNGKSTTLDALPSAVAAWGQINPQVHFAANPDAAYDCIDRVLTILKAADVPMQLRFVGNEAVAPENPK